MQLAEKTLSAKKMEKKLSTPFYEEDDLPTFSVGLEILASEANKNNTTDSFTRIISFDFCLQFLWDFNIVLLHWEYVVKQYYCFMLLVVRISTCSSA